MSVSPIQRPLPVQPVDGLTVHRPRRPLARTRHKLAQGELVVGFAGGSITADFGASHNWPAPVMRWLMSTFPDARISVENIAIGATGSDSGCVRADAELIARGCDLTFVEYAVNDADISTDRRNRSREGLIRKLLTAGQDVVLVYTFRQDFYSEMIEGRVPASIAEFEVLADHYGLSSIWMGLAALKEVGAGSLTWEEWLPDGLHPLARGSLSYAQAVIALLRHELAPEKIAAATEPSAPSLSSALDPRNWQGAKNLPLASVRTVGPWLRKRIGSIEYVDQVLETHAPGARLEFDFDGFGLVLLMPYGKRSAEFNYRIDEGDWIPISRLHHDWGGERGIYTATFLTEDLPVGPHHFEMVVTHGNRADCTGTECRVATVGILA